MSAPEFVVTQKVEPLNMKNLKGLVAVIWLTFIFVAAALAFAIYNAVVYGQYRQDNPPPPPVNGPLVPATNWNWLPYTTIALSAVGAIMIITLVALTRKGRYVATNDGYALSTRASSLTGNPTVQPSPIPTQYSTPMPSQYPTPTPTFTSNSFPNPQSKLPYATTGSK